VVGRNISPLAPSAAPHFPALLENISVDWAAAFWCGVSSTIREHGCYQSSRTNHFAASSDDSRAGWLSSTRFIANPAACAALFLQSLIPPLRPTHPSQLCLSKSHPPSCHQSHSPSRTHWHHQARIVVKSSHPCRIVVVGVRLNLKTILECSVSQAHLSAQWNRLWVRDWGQNFLLVHTR
jgi:hypothetical protein